jgi:hypothetical protein
MISSITADLIDLPPLHQRRVREISSARLAYLFNAIQRQRSWLFGGSYKLTEAIRELSYKEDISHDEAVSILQVFGIMEREIKPLKN